MTSGDDKEASIDDNVTSGQGSGSSDGPNRLLETTKDSTIMGEDEVDEALKSSLKKHTSKEEQDVIDGGMSDAELPSDKPASEDDNVHISGPKSKENEDQVDIDNTKKGDDKVESIDGNEKTHEASDIDGNGKSDANQEAVGVDATVGKSTSIDKVGKPEKIVEMAPASSDNQGTSKEPSSAKKVAAAVKTPKTASQDKSLDKLGTRVAPPAKTASFTSENQFSSDAGNGDDTLHPPAIPVVQPEVANTIADQSAGLGPVTQAGSQTQALSFADSQPTADNPQSPAQDSQAFTNGMRFNFYP